MSWSTNRNVQVNQHTFVSQLIQTLFDTTTLELTHVVNFISIHTKINPSDNRLFKNPRFIGCTMKGHVTTNGLSSKNGSEFSSVQNPRA